MAIRIIGDVVFKSADDSKVVHVYRQRDNDRKDLGVIDRHGNFNSGADEVTSDEKKVISGFLDTRTIIKES